jgi:hypothetical protein
MCPVRYSWHIVIRNFNKRQPLMYVNFGNPNFGLLLHLVEYQFI